MASSTMRYQKAALALRANLKRRKAQARARAEAGSESVPDHKAAIEKPRTGPELPDRTP